MVLSRSVLGRGEKNIGLSKCERRIFLITLKRVHSREIGM